MQDKFMLGLVAVFALSAIILLGTGISGFVISESCCFGPGCTHENLCDSAKLTSTHQNDLPTIYMGLIALIVSAIMVIKLFYDRNGVSKQN